jgi:hypothetical protein
MVWMFESCVRGFGMTRVEESGRDVERERNGLMKSKRQTTRAKLARERLVQERRALKREKKQAAAAARNEAAAPHEAPALDDTVSTETAE